MDKRTKEERLAKVGEHMEVINGTLVWLKPTSSRVVKGRPVGWVTGNGYRKASFNKVEVPVHHLVWLMMTGTLPEDDIDHINRDRLDNRIENLREVSRAGNLYNTDDTPRGSNPERNVYYRGSQHSKPWIVRVGRGSGNYYGIFTSKEEATLTAVSVLQSKRKEHLNDSI